VQHIDLSPHNRSLALLGTLWRVAEGALIAFNEVNNVVLFAVAEEFVSTTGAEVVTLGTLGRALIVAEDWGLKIGVVFFALGSLLYGFCSFRPEPARAPWAGGGRCCPPCRRRKVVSSGQPR
jgi:hypothetical protein